MRTSTPAISAPLLFDHSQHQLQIDDLEAPLSVLAFRGEEQLSQPFCYQIEFTSTDKTLTAEQMLMHPASLSLKNLAKPPLSMMFPRPPPAPLRVIQGVVTHFSHLATSRDESRYQLTLEPRLALLSRSHQQRIYQQQSVPEIVEKILRERHGFRGQDFLFTLAHHYPAREMVMQYGEDDLTFINRLLAEIGIWYRFVADTRLEIDVVEFYDDQRFYQFDFKLPLRQPSGLNDNHTDSAWGLQSDYQVVEKNLFTRDYRYVDAEAYLDGEKDITRGAKTTYGEAYHYADNLLNLGDKYAQEPEPESSHFYAKLHHERYLNQQATLSGFTTSTLLALGCELLIDDATQVVFKNGVVITGLTCFAARDRSFEVQFTAIPYSETVCYRPTPTAKPSMAGTLPARITSTRENDPYGHIDLQGRYRVNFHFDRDSWKRGSESAWLRLARPYAGDTYGLHTPLLAGTEVAIAFENGDPDRPYIAHALHDSKHPDLVTLRNYKRNVLRTPANNKLRLDDTRGEEHIKLSTEYSGKSQLNLGHLVDSQKKPRGEGAELRTDGWAAIRGGKGIFLSADAQPKAQGQQLEMAAALAQLEQAMQLVKSLVKSATTSEMETADANSQQQLKRALDQLNGAGLLASAPAGIALTTPKNIQLSAGKTLTVTAGENVDISLLKRFTLAVGERISLFAHRFGMKLAAAQGPVEILAQTGEMKLTAQQNMALSSVNGELVLTAEQGITLVSRGAYITLKDGSIEIGAPGAIKLKNDHIEWGGSASLASALKPMVIEEPKYLYPMDERFQLKDKQQQPQAYVTYRIESADGKTIQGVTDEKGYTQQHYGFDGKGIDFFFE